MPYRFLKSDEDVQAGLRRIATEQIDKALEVLEVARAGRADAVHEVRKVCKKLRGLIRLVRPAFPAYVEENKAFRGISGLLGQARDAEVMEHTLAAVVDEYGDALDPSAQAAAGSALPDKGDPASAAADLDARFSQAREQLEAARERAAGWVLEESGWDAIAAGLAKTYARARDAMRAALRHPDGEHHHEWRKRVKYHWYHARLLRDVWPDRLKERASEAHELAELLGDHHDSHVLEQHLRKAAAGSGDREQLEALVALARRRRAVLEERAHRLGIRLQADKPKALVKRWGKWWRAWQEEGDLREAALGR